MDELEISAPTVELAVEEALEQLGVTRSEVEVTVLSEGRGGILGMGAQAARVRVARKSQAVIASTPVAEPITASGEVGERAKAILQDLLSHMGLESATVAYGEPPLIDETEDDVTPVTLEVTTPDSGILIGRRGETLASLQYMVNLIIAHQVKAWVPIIIDVEGYKKRRYEALKALALRLADQVKLRHEPFTLEPMPAYERRIIHLTLADDPDVTTKSMDAFGERKVVIMPKEK